MPKSASTYYNVPKLVLETSPPDNCFIHGAEEGEVKFFGRGLKPGSFNLVPITPHHYLTEHEDEDIPKLFWVCGLGDDGVEILQ